MKLTSHLITLTLPLVLAACGTHFSAAREENKLNPAKLAIAADIQKLTQQEQFVPNQWFIELKADPTDEQEAAQVIPQQQQFLSEARKVGLTQDPLYQYETLFNGFVFAINENQANRLRNLSFVKDIYPVRKIKAPVIHTETNSGQETPEMFFARNATRAQELNDLGLTGKKVRVGVIDSGLDLTHPAFQGRIVAKWDFVSDDSQPLEQPTNNPEDCMGHGTHVAGIIGGKDPNYQQDGVAFSGVAPDAQIGVYRVFGCRGDGNQAITIKAMEQAYKDGMKVVNLSMSTDFFNWSQGGDALVASRLVKKGMVVVASAGNAGSRGAYTVGGVSMGENVISVASTDNQYDMRLVFQLTDGRSFSYYHLGGTPSLKEVIKLPLVKSPTSQLYTPNDGCDPNQFAPGSFKNKVALIRYGGCATYDKMIHAEQAGAAAVIVYGDNRNQFSLEGHAPAGKPPATIPGFFVLPDQGTQLFQQVNKTEVILAHKRIPVKNDRGNTASGFTSYGMTAELEIKPDVAAPGGSILSTVPRSREFTGYSSMSGTSMASPHVAGLAALLLEGDRTLNAKEVRQLLINTASPIAHHQSKDLNHVERVGAGLANISNAYYARIRDKVSVTPSKLELLDSHTFPTKSEVVTVHNKGDQPIVYTVRHLPATTAAGTVYEPKLEISYAHVVVNGQAIDENSSYTITVPARGEAELNLEITAPAHASEFSRYSGYIQLSSVTAADLVVPYAGLKGNIFDIPSFGTLISADNNSKVTSQLKTPYLIDELENKTYPRDEEATSIPEYTLSSQVNAQGKTVSDVPTIFMNFAHSIKNLKIEIIGDNGSYLLHNSSYFIRNCTNNLSKASDSCLAGYPIPWNGLDPHDNPAPNGVYQFRVTALKPLGTPGVKGHEDIYLSPKFRIKH